MAYLNYLEMGVYCENVHKIIFSRFLTTVGIERENISSGFSSNSEASASELLENPEEMFHRYYMDSDVISWLIFWCDPSQRN